MPNNDIVPYLFHEIKKTPKPNNGLGVKYDRFKIIFCDGFRSGS